jgi:hypothetical protein
MNLCVRTTFISLWLFLSSSLSAQIGFSLPVVNNISPNATVNFPVKVTGFDSIAGAQFIIRWNPQVFQYQTIDSFKLADLSIDDFGTTQALDSGKVRLLWAASNLLKGETLPDQTAIFRLRLKAIGPDSSGSEVFFTQDFFTPFDVVQANADSSLTSYGIDSVDLAQGFGAIGYTVSAGEPSAADDFQVQIFPNPFFEKTQVVFDLKMSCDVQISVTDAAGRPLFEKAMPRMQPGQHGTEIASPLLRETGIYFLIIRAGTHSCVRPLIVF